MAETHRHTLRALRPFLIDVVAPICAYFGLKAMGASDFLALSIGGGVAAADGLVSLVVERRIRWLPIFVFAMFVVTGALAYLTHNPRVLLLKASIASGAMGAYLLGLAVFRPALGRVLGPLIARGSDEREQRWATAWRQDPSLRWKLSFACLLGGLALLAEAAGRAAIVFSFSIGQSLFLEHAPAVILVAVLVLILRFLVTPAVVRAMAATP